MVYVGRSDQQIKIRGFRIELGEIEAIMRQHPTVSQAVVTLREDQSGERRLVAYVMVKNGSEFCVDSLREFVRTKLPEYMVPAAMVQMDEIPLTASGKTDYNGLPLVSSAGTSTPDIHYVAPRNPIEERIAEACCHLLSIQRIGIHDNFFDLGGHSLLAMRLMTWAHETSQSEAVPLLGFFWTPTTRCPPPTILSCQPPPPPTQKIPRFLRQPDAHS